MSLLTLWRNEPVRVASFLAAVLAVLAGFGIVVPDVNAVIALPAAVAFLLGGEAVRSQTTPANPR